MQPREQPPPAEQPESVGRIAAALSVWRALGATVLVAALIGGLLNFRSPPPSPSAIGDAVTQNEASARAASFAALGTLSLTAVPAPAILAAVDDMGLSPMEKEALLRTLSAASEAGARTEPAAQPATVAEPNSAGASNAAAAPSATAQPQRLRLADWFGTHVQKSGQQVAYVEKLRKWGEAFLPKIMAAFEAGQ
jgi:hypothetical protein